jgi:hypothetical protein
VATLNPIAVMQDLYALKNVAYGFIQNLKDAPDLLVRGIEKIQDGDLAAGIADILVSLTAANMQLELINPDLLVTLVQEGIIAVQTRLALEPIGRPLNSHEREVLRSVFGNSLNLDPILIKEGWSGLWMLSGADRPLTTQNTIYMKSVTFDDVLVHEAMHAWQFQNHGTRYKHEALIAQQTSGYDWTSAYKQGVAVQDLDPEKQAKLVEAGYRNVLQRGRKVGNPYTQTVTQDQGSAYFVKALRYVSDNGWAGRFWKVAGKTDAYFLGTNGGCRLTSTQRSQLGASLPQASTMPLADGMDVDEDGAYAGLPSCADAELTGLALKQLAWGAASGMVTSTGNIYWTHTSHSEFGPSRSYVMRAGKNNVPVSETFIYSVGAPSGGSLSFGSLAYASIGRAYYAYFMATYGGASPATRILRVPLDANSREATVIATLPVVAPMAQLKVDGGQLYFTDGAALRKLPIGGGAITTLATGLTSDFGFDAERVFFLDGQVIKSVPKAGGSSTYEALSLSMINALYVHVAGTTTSIYYGDAAGNVTKRVIGGPFTNVF